MVDAILLVLREVLEATLIITLLLAMSRKLLIGMHWLLPALLLGIISSWLLAHYAYDIADAWEGTGQEWTNAILYLLVIVAFIIINLIISPMLFAVPTNTHYFAFPNKIFTKTLLIYSAVFAVGLSLAREVAEIWIYLNGFAYQENLLEPALMGGAIGLGIGISLGVIIYYLLISTPIKLFLYGFYLFLILLCGGLSMQIAKQLLQIGILDSTEPLWDSSGIVNEHSWQGELLYALIGYDASPAAIQIIFYCLAISPLLLAAIWNWYHRKNNA